MASYTILTKDGADDLYAPVSHEHPPTAITDLTEYVNDAVAALIKAGSNVTTSYDDAANTFTINATASGGGTTDPEVVRDTIGGALVAGSGISVTVNDAADTITIAVAGVPQNAVSGLTTSLAALQAKADSAVVKGELTYNVKDFGAVGDGTTNDTAAIQAAIAYAAASGRSATVFLPAGIYITGTLTLAANTTLRGTSRYRSELKAAPGTTGGILTIPAGFAQVIYVEDLAVNGNNVAGLRGIYFHAQGNGQTPNQGGWWYGAIRRVRVKNCASDGIWLRGGGPENLTPHQFGRLEHVEVFATPTGAALRITGQVGQFTFSDCQFDGPGKALGTTNTTNVHIYQETTADGTTVASDRQPYALTFANCTFQANALGVLVRRAYPVVFTGCYFEDLYSGIETTSTANLTVVRDCSFQNAGANTGGTGFVLKAGSNCTIVADGIEVIGAFDTAMFQATANSGDLRIENVFTTASGGVPSTSGLTRQPTVASNVAPMGMGRTAIITSSPAIHSVTSRLATGESMYLRAFNADFTFISGGNINLGGRTSPVTVTNGQTATLVRFDLGSVWQLVSIA